MNGYMEITIQYGFTASDKYTHKMRFLGDGGSNMAGVDSSLSLIYAGSPADYGPVSGAGFYIFNYVKCLEQMCQPGIQIINVVAEQFNYTDWGTRYLVYTAHYDLSNFTVRSGNTAAAGPRGRDFIAARQPSAISHRTGWLRFHYVEGRILSKATILTPTDISTVFDGYYANLRNLAAPISSYATLSAVASLDLQPEVKGIPGVTLHQGLRNG